MRSNQHRGVPDIAAGGNLDIGSTFLRRPSGAVTYATHINVDLAKNVFHIPGSAADGSDVYRKKLSRPQFARFMSELPLCLLAMKACTSGHRFSWISVAFATIGEAGLMNVK